MSLYSVTVSKIISSDLDESHESIFWCKKKQIWRKIGIPRGRGVDLPEILHMIFFFLLCPNLRGQLPPPTPLPCTPMSLRKVRYALPWPNITLIKPASSGGMECLTLQNDDFHPDRPPPLKKAGYTHEPDAHFTKTVRELV